MVGWVLVAVGWYLTIAINPMFAILAGLVSVWKLFRLWLHYGRPWRRVHYPLMRAYAASAGAESGLAECEGREFSINNSLSTLVLAVYPHWTGSQAQAFAEKQLERRHSGQDIGPICEFAIRKKWELDAIENLRKYLEQARVAVDNATMVRWVIAGVIENTYGTVHRTEYLFEAVVTGRAN